jgi:hypothetical protein
VPKLGGVAGRRGTTSFISDNDGCVSFLTFIFIVLGGIAGFDF